MVDAEKQARSVQIEEMLAKVEKAEIARVLAEFVPASEIGLRSNWQDHAYWWSSITSAYKIPKDPRKRVLRMREVLATLQAELARDVQCYSSLYGQGPAGLSEWDLSNCLLIERDVVDEWRCALRLKDAHVSYHRTMIHAMMTELDLLE